MSSRLNSHRKKFGPVSPSSDIQFSGITDSAVRNALCLVSYELVDLWKKDGTVLRGHFGGVESVSGELNLVLRYAFIKSGDPYALNPATDRRGNVADRIRIPVSDFVRMDAAFSAVDRNSTSSSHTRGRARPDSRSFATDGQIANRANSGPGRELKKFDDFSEFPAVSSGASSAGIRNGGRDAETFGDVRNGGKWDQFKVNEEKFGVSASFDESQYTTTIDRSSADFRAREREAARIAAEIENKISPNIHMQEERNQSLPADLDEEAMYSGVQRPKPASLHPTSTMNSRNKNLHNGAGVANSYPTKGSAGGDQSMASGPAKQDARARNGGPSKFPQRSAIPPKAVWGSKNSQSKSAALPKANQPPKATKFAAKVSATSKPAATPTSKSSAGPSSQSAASTAKNPAAMPKVPAPVAKSSIPNPKGSATAHAAKLPTVPITKPAVIAKSTPATKKLSYAAAAGASVHRKVQPASPLPTDLIQVPRPPRSPMSPSKPNTGKSVSATGVAPSVARMGPARVHNTGRIPNGGRTPPATTRTSPSVARNSPSNPETSAMDALSLEPPSPKIVKSFEQYKTNKVSHAMTENRQEITNELKKFSTDLDAKRGGPRKSSAASVATGKSETPGFVANKETIPVAKQKGTDTKSIEPKLATTSLASGAGSVAEITKEDGDSKLGEKKKATRKMTKKLNPDAASWVPGAPISTPGTTTPQSSYSLSGQAPPTHVQPSAQMSNPPMSGAPNVDAYFHMSNFGNVAPSVAPGIPPEHQAAGYGFQMGPPVGHPSNMPYAGYASMMVPPGMPQNPAAFPYMANARTPYIMPGNGNRFPPGAPPGGMGFGIPVSMMPNPPNQGNQRSPGMSQYSYPQYMHGAQPPMPMQPAMAPPYGHPQQVVPPTVAQPVVSPRSSMGGSGGGSAGNSRRSGPKGRGRHGHQHQQSFGSEHQNQSQQATSKQAGYASAPVQQPHTGQGQWYPSSQGSKAPLVDEGTARSGDVKKVPSPASGSQVTGSGKANAQAAAGSQTKPRQ